MKKEQVELLFVVLFFIQVILYRLPSCLYLELI
jgi:hypothetical protein